MMTGQILHNILFLIMRIKGLTSIEEVLQQVLIVCVGEMDSSHESNIIW